MSANEDIRQPDHSIVAEHQTSTAPIGYSHCDQHSMECPCCGHPITAFIDPGKQDFLGRHIEYPNLELIEGCECRQFLRKDEELYVQTIIEDWEEKL